MFELDFSILFHEAVINETYLDWLLEGAKWTIISSSASWFLALVLGIIVGTMRTLPSKTLRFLGATYVECLRNVPLIVQLFFWYYVWPNLMPAAMGDWIKGQDPLVQMMTAGILCLGLFTSARIAEQVRSSIESLAGGQMRAALASGLSLPQAYRYVILPQALRIILPPMTSELLNIFKNSSVLQTIGLAELTRQAAQINDYTAKAYESFILVTLAYIIINVTLMFIMKAIEHFTQLPTLKKGA